MKRYLYNKLAKPGITAVLTIAMLSSATLVQAATVKNGNHCTNKTIHTQHIKR